MAPHPTASKPSGGDLAKRIVSALVLAPSVLAAIYFGPPYSDVLVFVAAVLMTWEWCIVTGGETLDRTTAAAVGSVALAIIAGVVGSYQVAVWLLAVGAMGVVVLLARGSGPRAAWLAFGICYVGLACLAFQWLRVRSLDLVILLLVVVWATDIAAYFVGRRLGGPKLAPTISPKKTWSGLCGGAGAAALAAGVTAAALGWNPVTAAFLGACLAVVSQGGDLLESQLKRRYGVKDASHLIPGHGGLLDRADGLMAAGLVMAVAMWFTGP
jgi:phosphatidate cytidylyltransferase